MDELNKIQRDVDALHVLVNRYGQRDVLLMLARVCRDKAHLVRDARNDDDTACHWENDAGKIERCAHTVEHSGK